MKFYQITLQPRSAFATPLKGDTLFGHFCWQAAHDPSLLEGGLDTWIRRYGEQPFAIFSSAYIKTEHNGTCWFLKRPDLPLSFFKSYAGLDKKERILKAKEMKKQKWMQINGSLNIDLAGGTFLNDTELLDILENELSPETRRSLGHLDQKQVSISFSQPHNSINRLTGTTGRGGMFAPFTTKSTCYFPEVELVIFVLIEESATDIERVLKGITRIGQWGFGKDASTGMGRFEVAEHDPMTMPDISNTMAFYTLAPSVPEQGFFNSSGIEKNGMNAFFTPFTRFGKHGSTIAVSGNPFKNPVIMADEGAVFIPDRTQAEMIVKKQYMGTAVGGISKSMPHTVAQGYTPVLPMQLA
ncbi:CRISPR-associated protein, Csm4 family [Desulfamplus magnetovallimortis]|uniref:CRISPR system Cms protein Csm4 n=1 Tax=Desulfamplus magnetovallimortis TaxID=1246637 RepID=A0A1W1HIX5_9BACT|nr:hypothetical protein [Desulfamplus magnetovallimortis]SLM32393.1 CRISPR-associated protein, Csm4 family [Desulfamplus magnetovallimortis]